MTIPAANMNDWHPVAIHGRALTPDRKSVVLMGRRFEIERKGDGWVGRDENGRPCECVVKFGHVWLCPGEPAKPLFDIPEADQPGRQLTDVGMVRVKCSPLRAVENFLDIAHFPFVHTDILGAEPHTEVERYKVEIEEDNDEVWAREVKFFQPQAAKSASGGIMAEYAYRVPAPMVAILYKSCPARPEERDVIAIFVQPVSEESCDVWPWMALFDDESTMAEMIQFQQTIFLQDRSILENQIPRRLPLDPRMETPTRADLTSVAYRRWLKKRGALYGALTEAV